MTIVLFHQKYEKVLKTTQNVLKTVDNHENVENTILFGWGGFKSPPQLVGLKRDSMRGRGMANEKWKAFITYID